MAKDKYCRAEYCVPRDASLLAQLEQQLDYLLLASGLPETTLNDLSTRATLPEEVKQLLAQRKIAAAQKLYQKLTGTSLMEANDAVQGVRKIGYLPLVLLRKMDVLRSQLGIAPEPPVVPRTQLSADSLVEAERLIREGDLIAAVKIYHAQTDLSLKEIQDAVKEIARRLRG